MLNTFHKRAIRMPQHPEVSKAYSYLDSCIYINVNARPGANVVLYEAPADIKPR